MNDRELIERCPYLLGRLLGSGSKQERAAELKLIRKVRPENDLCV